MVVDTVTTPKAVSIEYKTLKSCTCLTEYFLQFKIKLNLEIFIKMCELLLYSDRLFFGRLL